MRLYSLQLLRFFAALFVLLFHLELMASGYKGVDVFFVISGFVMYYTAFLIKRKSIKAFYINRLTKIFLLYWIALLIFYFVRPFEIDSSFLETIFLFPNHYPVLSISWTLSYELYFYFIFGIIAYIVKKKFLKEIIFWIFFIVASVVTVLNTTNLLLKGTLLNFLLGQNFWEFLLGIIAAVLSEGIFQKLNKRIILLFIVTGLFALLFIEIPYTNGIYHLVYGPASFLIIAAVAAYELKHPLNKYAASIFGIAGDASYAIYLLHPVTVLLIPSRDAFSKMLIIVITVLAAILMNQLIENNLLKVVRGNLLKLIAKI